jgi:antitoxin YefM
MKAVSVNQFRDQLKRYVEAVTNNHDPLMVTRRNGPSFVVIAASDWAQEQETLYILQNESLMKQIAESSKTFSVNQGNPLSKEQQDEIDSI